MHVSSCQRVEQQGEGGDRKQPRKPALKTERLSPERRTLPSRCLFTTFPTYSSESKTQLQDILKQQTILQLLYLAVLSTY